VKLLDTNVLVYARHPKSPLHLLDWAAKAAARCGEAYGAYRNNRKKGSGKDAPKMPLPDFFIGSHAELLGLELVTNDPDRYRTHFPQVKLITP
jgi:predicted nucleic acid-binding protein